MIYTDSRCFIDTNILVYSINSIDKKKTKICRTLLKDLARTANGILSEQVLLELFNVLTKKLKLDSAEARKIAFKFSKFELTYSNDSIFRNTLDLSILHKISIWDAHILSAAANSRAKYLISEDLNSGQDYYGVVVVNPFE